MWAHRVIRILVAVLMAHFTVVGGDANCSRHGDRETAQHHQPDHAAAGASTAGTLAPAEQPCETPTQPECCRALTSCSVSVLVESGARSLPAFVRHQIGVDAMKVPLSLDTAPDPPPPKAQA